MRQTTTHWLALVAMLASAPVSAQSPAPVARPVPLAEAPVTSEARGWIRRDGAILEGVRAQGPATRVTAATDLQLAHEAWTLTGAFTVSASFQRTARTSATAPYGLTLGSTGRGPALAFVVRPDGAWALLRGATDRAAAPWTPTTRPARPSTIDGPAADRLEIRVDATTAACFLNGTPVATVAVTPGELDGHPGVQVGANGDVLVMMFTVVGSRELFVK